MLASPKGVGGVILENRQLNLSVMGSCLAGKQLWCRCKALHRPQPVSRTSLLQTNMETPIAPLFEGAMVCIGPFGGFHVSFRGGRACMLASDMSKDAFAWSRFISSGLVQGTIYCIHLGGPPTQ